MIVTTTVRRMSSFVAGIVLALCLVAGQEAWGASNGFIPTADMVTSRFGHTATLMNNGKVLVAGGFTTSTPIANAELYDPVTGTWTAVPDMGTVRGEGSAVLLPNGKVLVAGGNAGSSTATKSAELYDPVANTWTPTNPMITARYQFTLILLNDGTVLAAGGADAGGGNAFVQAAEVYDFGTGNWTAVGSLAFPHVYYGAAKLNTGNVLFAGAFASSKVELYNPTSKTFSTPANCDVTFSTQHVEVFNNGQALMVGGDDISNFSLVADCDLFIPATPSIAVTGTMTTPRKYAATVRLFDGSVLAVSGNDASFALLKSAETYSQATGLWTATSLPISARSEHTATLLQDHRVLIAGGAGKKAELFAPSFNLIKPKIALGFKSIGKDSINFSATFDVSIGTNLIGTTARVDIGGAVQTFTLLQKGANKTGNDAFSFAVKKPKKGAVTQTVTVKVKLTKHDYRAPLSDEGLTAATTTKVGTANVLYSVTFNGETYSKFQSMTFASKKNVSCKAK